MPYSKLSTDSKIREFQRRISTTEGNIKNTSDPELKKILINELNKIKADLARYAQNKK
jgi:hypothetical protein